MVLRDVSEHLAPALGSSCSRRPLSNRLRSRGRQSQNFARSVPRPSRRSAWGGCRIGNGGQALPQPLQQANRPSQMRVAPRGAPSWLSCHRSRPTTPERRRARRRRRLQAPRYIASIATVRRRGPRAAQASEARRSRHGRVECCFGRALSDELARLPRSARLTGKSANYVASG